MDIDFDVLKKTIINIHKDNYKEEFDDEHLDYYFKRCLNKEEQAEWAAKAIDQFIAYHEDQEEFKKQREIQ